MISPSLHPEPVRAACERRRRWAFGLTPRSLGLLIAGAGPKLVERVVVIAAPVGVVNSTAGPRE